MKRGVIVIQEKVIQQMLVASSQHFVNYVTDNLIEQFNDNFEKHFLETGAKKTEPQNFFTVFHVDEYKERDYHMELWMQVEALKENTDDIEFKAVPESEVAYVIVSENYENLKTTYEALFKYVQESGYIANGYPRETYLFYDNAPCGYFTEIQLPFTRNSIKT
jgi:effector-binding domain-containing protein